MAETKIKVLVVEDEHIILKYIGQKLEKADPDVEIVGLAEDAKTAIEMIRETPPDILFTDIEMPVIDGIELIGWIKENCPGVQVVVISGYSNFEYAQAALRYGVFDYLLKPIETVELEKVLAGLKEKICAQRDWEAEKAQKPFQAVEELDQEQEPDLALQVKKYIDLYFNTTLTVAQLADQFNYSPAYINRIFRKEFDVAPMRYQTQVRIRKAKKLLDKHKNADIKDIAGAVGYEDSRYFSRVFKQIVGESPSEYLQNKHKHKA